VQEVYGALLLRLRATGETPVVHENAPWAVGPQLVLELVKDGVVPAVSPRDQWIFGRQLPAEGETAHPLHVYAAESEPKLEVAPCLDPLTRSGELELRVAPLDVVDCEGEVGFGDGFSPRERGDGRTWHWIGRRGRGRVKTGGRDGILTVTGWVPLEILHEPPTVTVRAGPQTVVAFVPVQREFSEDLTVQNLAPPPQPWLEITIETNRVGRSPPDTRELGVAIETLRWTSKP
jgi:hypothetical protein